MNHLHPQTISPQTFQRLLSLYPKTVDLLSRRKAAAKIKRKPPAAATPKTKQKSSWTSTGTRSEAEEEFITAKANEFLSVDGFRYEGLPGVVATRAEKDDDGSGHGYGYLEKDELVRLMEWKMQHGTFRPALLGMIRSNSEPVVRDATGRAFKALTTHHTSKDGGEEKEKFPSEALDILTKALRGVGVATASLVLSLASTADVPFYSDDVYLWVCMEEVPSTSTSGCGSGEGEAEAADRLKRGVYKRLNGELSVKYTMKEYRELWEGVKGLRERLEGKEKGVSGLEVEKVALVVRHYAFLGGGQSVDGDWDGGGGDKKGSEGMKVEEEEENTREKRKLEDERPTGEGRRRSKRLDSRRINPA